jgi:anti-anti-sigma factor
MRKRRVKMLHRNEIKLEQRGSVTLLDIQGDIPASSEPFLNEAYKNADNQDTSNILLKIERDIYINSGGIAVIIQILAQTKQNNQLIRITGISDHFKKIFSMVGITRFAQIYDTVEEALEMMAES